MGLPKPAPCRPCPWVTEPVARRVGDGGTTLKLVPKEVSFRDDEAIPTWTCGGTTEVLPISPATGCLREDMLPVCTCGGTTCRCITGPKPGPRGAKSCVSVGAGATGLSEGKVSRAWAVNCSGAETGGGTTCNGFEPGNWYGCVCCTGTVGAGATTFIGSVGARSVLCWFNSGAGATAAIWLSCGAERESCKPSAGGGPGTAW